MAQLGSTQIPKASNRKRAIILLAIGVFLLLAMLVSQTAFDLKFLRPGNNQEIVVFAALSALIFLLFVALTFVLARNLLKLFAERRLGVLGSKFRTRMVAGALLLSFVPIMVMYWFSYGLMNRSIDKWFSTPVEEVRADTHAMVSLLANYASQNARSEASAIASSTPAQRSFSGQGFSTIVDEFQHHEPTLQGGFALAVQDGNAEASFNAPAPWPVLKSTLPLAEAMAGRPAQFTWEQTDYTLGSAPVEKAGMVLVAIPLPKEFSQTVKQVEANQDKIIVTCAHHVLRDTTTASGRMEGVAGGYHSRFEEEFRDYVKSAHGVAVNSCTAALHLSMVAAGIKPGDEVITTALTFCATANGCY